LWHRFVSQKVRTALSLLSGLLLCSKTHWGFFRHWWLIVKMAATIFVNVFCTLVIAPTDQEMIELSQIFGLAALHNPTNLSKKFLGMIVNPANIAILIFLAYLSFFKPWGRR
jgi:hypothetical protein